MMIYKYPLVVEDRQTVELPKGARILCVQAQRDTPMLWALVDEREPDGEVRAFRTYGTGHHMLPHHARQDKYIGTYQMDNGGLVFHVFEELV